MEDFATFCKNMPKEQNSPKKRSVKPANTKKTKWLSKTTFWNLFFWFGMSAGIAFALSISGMDSSSKEFNLWSSLVLWLTIIGVPLIVTLANKTRFIKDGTFTNSENTILTKKQLPTGNFIFATILGVGFTFLVAETILSKDLFKLLNSIIFFVCLFSGFSLYFIFKNCPISILFNRKFWKFEPSTGRARGFNDLQSSYSKSNLSIMRDRNNVITNPAYSSLSSNIYHRHR